MGTDKCEQRQKRCFSKELLHGTSTAASTQCYNVCHKLFADFHFKFQFHVLEMSHLWSESKEEIVLFLLFKNYLYLRLEVFCCCQSSCCSLIYGCCG